MARQGGRTYLTRVSTNYCKLLFVYTHIGIHPILEVSSQLLFLELVFKYLLLLLLLFFLLVLLLFLLLLLLLLLLLCCCCCFSCWCCCCCCCCFSCCSWCCCLASVCHGKEHKVRAEEGVCLGGAC